MPDTSPSEAYLVLITESGQRDVHPVTGAEMTLGRAAESDLVLTNPGVSRRHARLTWDGESFLVEDLGSKNGTWLNGEPLSKQTPLKDGDELELADSRLQFQLNSPTVTVTLPQRDQLALAVDLSTHEVMVRGEPVELTPKEFLLLALLYRRAGAVATRDEISQEVWPELEGAVAEENIEQLVARLRRKIELDPSNPEYLLTKRGFGYRLDLA
ncbi:MAG: winged helix-turn-helix domain-containing protein [Dehalococcoidia bacterium]|nr:winged helix-turn-helix domain-containing protein [Dehalococcoidia bacterium]